MNPNQIINLFMRLFGRKLMNAGIQKAVELTASKGKPREQMTEAERTAEGNMKTAVKRAQDAMKIVRRIR